MFVIEGGTIQILNKMQKVIKQLEKYAAQCKRLECKIDNKIYKLKTEQVRLNMMYINSLHIDVKVTKLRVTQGIAYKEGHRAAHMAKRVKNIPT